MVDADDARKAFQEQKISVSSTTDESEEVMTTEWDLNTQMDKVEDALVESASKKARI